MSDKTIVRCVHSWLIACVFVGLAMIAAVMFGIWADYPGKTGKHLTESFLVAFGILYVLGMAGIFIVDRYPTARKRIAANPNTQEVDQ